MDFKLSQHLQQLLILQGLGRLIDALQLLLLEGRLVERRARSAGGSCLLSTASFPGAELDLEAVDGDRDSPVSISCSRSNCEPHECRRRSASTAAGPEPRGSLVKIPSTNKDFRERSVRSGKRSQPCAPLPSKPRTARVSPAVMKRLQGDTHGLNKRDLPSPLVPLLDMIQVNCNQCSVLSSAGLCISVKSACRHQNRTDTQRAQF